jgi:hypothetical protein
VEFTTVDDILHVLMHSFEPYRYSPAKGNSIPFGITIPDNLDTIIYSTLIFRLHILDFSRVIQGR